MKKEKRISVFPRLRLLPPRDGCKVLFSCLYGRGSPVSTTASDQQIAAIERRSVTLPAPGKGAVSYLQTGSGDGRRIIFVHGTPGSARGWVDYLLDVPAGQTYLALDRPGYGLSAPRSVAVSLKRQAQAILPLLGTVKNRRAILVGHSLGASVAIQAALDFPDRIGGLLLLAGAFDPALEEAHWLQPVGTLKPFSWLLPRSIYNANQELLGLKRDLIAQVGRLQQISIPVTTVHGDKDPLVPVTNVHYLQQKLANSPLEAEILKNKDHFIPWNSKSTVDQALERLIDRVCGTEQ